jgi:uridine kinase
MDVEILNKIFVLSANHKKGTTEELENYLGVLLSMCKKGEVPFSSEEAESFLTLWKEQGYPAISHSETYRMNYQPAYRVVEGKFGKFYQVFLWIDRLLKERKEEDRPLVVCIDGMAGSGKSTLGALLKEIYDCNLFHMDDYFLQPYQRTEERLAEPGGNVDYERFKEEVYDKFDSQQEFTYQKYDCSRQALGDFVKVAPTKLNIIEGAYSTHPYFEDRADLMFFMEIPDQLQIYRIGARNGEWMLQRFIKEWIPMEHRYFEEFGIRNKCISVCGD